MFTSLACRGMRVKGESIPLKSEVCTHPSLFGPLRGYYKKKLNNNNKDRVTFAFVLGGETTTA